MSGIHIVLAAGVVAEGWLIAYAVLRIRRTLAKFAFVALVLDVLVATAAFVGVQINALPAPWWTVALWTFVLAHPLGCLFLVIAIYGEGILRRFPYVFLILAPAPALLVFAPPAGYDLANAYATSPLNWYLVLCLALPLGEAAAAWHRSVARRPELFLLLAGAVVLVLTGPVYGFELEAVGLVEGAGSNPGAALAAALFAAALTVANPVRVRAVPKGSAGDPTFPGGQLLLADESRPKATAHFVALAAQRGRAALNVVRGSPTSPPVGPGALAVATLGPSTSPTSVLLSTAAEFLARHPGGLVFVRDLSYLVTLAGPSATKEAVESLARSVRGTRGTVVASLSLLTPSERRELLALPGVRPVRLPDPAVEFEAILAASLGGAAAQLLKSFAAREHRRAEDLTYEDLPALQRFLGSALAELARAPGDEPLITGWRKTLDRVNLDLDRFARRSCSILPRNRPSP